MKKLVCLLLCVIFILCGCGSAPAETVPETTTEPLMSFSEYAEMVSSVVDSIYADSAILASAIRYQNTYWSSLEKLSGTVTPEKLVEAAGKWLEEESEGEYTFELLLESKNNIVSMRNDIVSVSVDSPTDEIGAAFEAYFSAYMALYDITMSPPGSQQELVDAANSQINAISNAKTMLDNLLS